MMTLFAFLATVAAIVGIARYNEDDALFWKLFISLAGAYAAVAIALNVVNSDEKKQDKVVMIENAPTQVLGSMPSLNAILAGVSCSAAEREKSPKPVSKDKLFNQNNIILSKVHAYPRGRPTWRMFFDDG